jgi:hypothetical protein
MASKVGVRKRHVIDYSIRFEIASKQPSLTVRCAAACSGPQYRWPGLWCCATVQVCWFAGGQLRCELLFRASYFECRRLSVDEVLSAASSYPLFSKIHLPSNASVHEVAISADEYKAASTQWGYPPTFATSWHFIHYCLKVRATVPHQCLT